MIIFPTKDAWDLLEVSQTVMELIIVGQIWNKPVAAFLKLVNRSNKKGDERNNRGQVGGGT